MSKECKFCESTDVETITTVNITDSGGGSFASICGDCQEKVLTDRCVLCGTAKTGSHKAEDIVFEAGPDGNATTRPICDECRRGILDRL